MSAIGSIFILVVSAAAVSVFAGLHELCLFVIVKSSKGARAQKGLAFICHIFYAIISLLFVFFGFFYWVELLCSTNLGCYIAVIVYTLLLALMSTDVVYLSPSIRVDSALKAFRKGFTSGSVNHIVPNLYLKTIINIFYLVILILAQIEDLGFVKFSDDVSYFFELNKYGIVIVFAIEKIIKSIAPEKRRKRIILDTFIEQENRDEKEREEMRTTVNEIKSIIKARRVEKRAKKEQRQKDKGK